MVAQGALVAPEEYHLVEVVEAPEGAVVVQEVLVHKVRLVAMPRSSFSWPTLFRPSEMERRQYRAIRPRRAPCLKWLRWSTMGIPRDSPRL